MCSGAGTAAAAATTGTDARTDADAAAGPCSPRLTAGAVRLKDLVLDYRPSDLTAIKRGTGKVRERVGQSRLRCLHRLRLSGG
jgi:hypothetical protein